MFKVIINIINLVAKGFIGLNNPNTSRSFRDLYSQYLNIENIISNASLVINHCFTVEIVDLSREEFDIKYDQTFHFYPEVPYDKSNMKQSFERWLFVINKDLKELNGSMQKFIHAMDPGCLYHLDPKLIDEFSSFFDKSGKLRFLHFFDAGSISADRTKLTISSLLMPSEKGFKAIKKSSIEAYRTQIVLTEFDISTVEKRLSLAKEAHENIQEMIVIKDRLRKYIKEHVTLEQLL